MGLQTSRIMYNVLFIAPELHHPDSGRVNINHTVHQLTIKLIKSDMHSTFDQQSDKKWDDVSSDLKPAIYCSIRMVQK